MQVVKDTLGNSSTFKISTKTANNTGGGNIDSNTALGNDALVCNSGGATSLVAIGSNAFKCATSGSSSVAIGEDAFNQGADAGSGNVAIGWQSMYWSSGVNCNTAVGRGSLICVTSDCNTAIGTDALRLSTSACGNTSVGAGSMCANTTGDLNTALGVCALGSVLTGSNNIGIGPFADTYSTACNTIAIGNTAKVFSGATGTMVFGASSVGGTGACNSIVLGNSAQTTQPLGVLIGQSTCTDQARSVVIGNGSCSLLGSYGGNTCHGAVVIGDRVCSLGNGNNSTYANVAVGSNIKICGNPINPDIVYGNTITTCNNNKGGNVAIGIDSYVCDNYNGVLLGFQSNITCSNYSIVIGLGSCASGGDTDGAQTIIGSQSRATALCSQVFGRLSCSTHVGAVVIGPNINSERADTVHVNSLIAYGQAASKLNAVGATGGTVTINWDNSNIQTLSLDSSITTLTKSNPIDGAVYTVFVTQGGTGSYTVDWGSDVNWPGGTPPTLSTAVAATDAVSLVYVAGITGYYGNANLNFS